MGARGALKAPCGPFKTPYGAFWKTLMVELLTESAMNDCGGSRARPEKIEDQRSCGGTASINLPKSLNQLTYPRIHLPSLDCVLIELDSS